MSWFTRVLEFLFPNHSCLCCKGELNAPKNIYICNKCADNLPINIEPVTLVNSDTKQYFTHAYSAFTYTDPIVNLILQFKYNSNGGVATALAPYMAAVLIREERALQQQITTRSVSVPILIPVPLCKKRQRKRGYNQAELLAKEISQILNLEVMNDVLIRTKETKTQKKMTVKEREENLHGAFTVTDKSRIKGLKIILVDDVFTSGSTVNECARILKKAGAKQIDIVVIARV